MKKHLSKDKLHLYLNYIKKDVRKITSDRRKMSFVIGVPVILVAIVFFSVQSSKPKPVRIAFSKTTNTTNPIYSSLEKEDSIVIVQGLPTDEVMDNLKKGKITAYINVKRLESPQAPFYKVDLSTSKISKQKTEFMTTFNAVKDKINNAFDANESHPAIEVETKEVSLE